MGNKDVSGYNPGQNSSECPWGGGGGNTGIYFLYRDVPTVRVSFSGSSVLNRVYTFSCLKQGRPRKSSPFLPLRSHQSFANFMRLRWNA